MFYWISDIILYFFANLLTQKTGNDSFHNFKD